MTYGMPSYKKGGVVEVAFASQAKYISVYVLKPDVMSANRAGLKGLSVGKSCIRYSSPAKIDWRVLEIHMVDVAQPPAYEALVLIGYIHSDKKYVIHWCDTYGGKFSAIGVGRRAGDSIAFEFQYPDGPFYNTFTWDAKANVWRSRMESQGEDGKRMLFAEDTFRRP